jgi:hypothetical protein
MRARRRLNREALCGLHKVLGHHLYHSSFPPWTRYFVPTSKNLTRLSTYHLPIMQIQRPFLGYESEVMPMKN